MTDDDDIPDEQDEMPQAQCPRCGLWEDDPDGFGILAHLGPTFDKPCGYCSHPSRTGGRCSICGDSKTEAF